MLTINKSEKIKLLKKFPDVHIVRTMKQKSKRHHYFVTEEPEVVAYLQELRASAFVEEYNGK